MGSQRKKKTVLPPLEERRCIIYTRVSSKDQAQEGWSLDAQLRMLRECAAAKGFTIALEFVEDETAKKPGRREFADMVRAVKRGVATEIVVEKVDRLYRNFKDPVEIDGLMQERGLTLHFAKDHTTLHKDSPASHKLMHDLQLVLAKNYIDNLSQEAKKGMLEKARQGHWPSRAPVGYKNVIKDHRRVIEPDPVVAPQVRHLYEAYAKGDISLKHVGIFAAALGLKNVNGSKLNPASVQWILRNPIYQGVVLWDGEEFPGRHEPLVSKELWQAVQDLMEGRKSKHTVAITKPDFAYRGIVRCGRCGCAASPYRAKGQYIYYACTGAKGCARTTVREECVTKAVVSELESLQIATADLKFLRGALKEAQEKQREDHRDRRKTLEATRESVWQRLDRLYLDRVNDDVPTSTYNRLKPTFEGELAEIDQALSGLERANLTSYDDNVALLEAISNSAMIYRAASAEHRRKMLNFMVSNCEIMDGTVSLTLRPWFKCVQEANLKVASGWVEGGEPSNWWAQLDSN